MSKDDALDFLKHMAADPESGQKVVAEYKKLLQDLAREKGFEFTDAELVEAAVALKDAAAGEVADGALATVVGGDGLFIHGGDQRFLLNPPPKP